VKGEAVLDAGRPQSSLDGLSERSIASIGSDPARKNPALGEPWGLVADEPLAVLLEARF
jgi:hypothetical protein